MAKAGDVRMKRTAAVAGGDLGFRLKAMFNAIAQGPMPEHLARLVDELERNRIRRLDVRH